MKPQLLAKSQTTGEKETQHNRHQLLVNIYKQTVHVNIYLKWKNIAAIITGYVFTIMEINQLL